MQNLDKKWLDRLWLAFVLLLWLLPLSVARAQSSNAVTVIFNLTDFIGNAQMVQRLVLQPIPPTGGVGMYGSNVLVPAKTSVPTGTNGSVTISNVATGYAYKVQLLDQQRPPAVIAAWTNVFPTNLAGQTVFASACLGVNAGPVFGWLLGAGTNVVFVYTNGTLYINSFASGGGGGGSLSPLVPLTWTNSAGQPMLYQDPVGNMYLDNNGGIYAFSAIFTNSLQVNGSLNVAGASTLAALNATSLNIFAGAATIDSSGNITGASLNGSGSGISFNSIPISALTQGPLGYALLGNGPGNPSSYQILPGGGTVTSIGLTPEPSLFSVSGSPVTLAGTLGFSLYAQNPGQIWASPPTVPGAPFFTNAPTFIGSNITKINAANVVGIIPYSILPSAVLTNGYTSTATLNGSLIVNANLGVSGSATASTFNGSGGGLNANTIPPTSILNETAGYIGAWNSFGIFGAASSINAHFTPGGGWTGMNETNDNWWGIQTNFGALLQTNPANGAQLFIDATYENMTNLLGTNKWSEFDSVGNVNIGNYLKFPADNIQIGDSAGSLALWAPTSTQFYFSGTSFGDALGTIHAIGSSLTALNASQLTSGTLPFSAVSSLTGSGTAGFVLSTTGSGLQFVAQTGGPGGGGGGNLFVIQTNWLVNTYYTNTNTCPILVNGTVTNIIAAITGYAAMELCVSNVGDANWSVLANVGLNSTGSTPAEVRTNIISAVISNNASFAWSNIVSGAGDASGFVSGTGQQTVLGSALPSYAITNANVGVVTLNSNLLVHGTNFANYLTVTNLLHFTGGETIGDYTGGLAFYDPTAASFYFGAQSLGAQDGNVYAATFTAGGNMVTTNSTGIYFAYGPGSNLLMNLAPYSATANLVVNVICTNNLQVTITNPPAFPFLLRAWNGSTLTNGIWFNYASASSNAYPAETNNLTAPITAIPIVSTNSTIDTVLCLKNTNLVLEAQTPSN